MRIKAHNQNTARTRELQPPLKAGRKHPKPNSLKENIVPSTYHPPSNTKPNKLPYRSLPSIAAQARPNDPVTEYEK
jgi:hypothetical protein